MNLLNLSQLGFDGTGVSVAVFDGGFINLDISPFLKHLWEYDKITLGPDLIEDDGFIIEGTSHGFHVLSLMAAKLDGIFTGTAPDASYTCIISEDTNGEFRTEEYSWLLAAEIADSLGVDIINSSLGYFSFNDESMNHQYTSLNGKKAIVSIAAAAACQKGMVVVNSAGNEGGGPWKYISPPADVSSVISVGAVDMDGKRASFSSVGPNYCGILKPNVMAPGASIPVPTIYGIDMVSGSGTSYAAPLFAGGLASLKEFAPWLSVQELKDAVYNTSLQYNRPDTLMGYGMADFEKAAWKIMKDRILRTGWMPEHLLTIAKATISLHLPFYGDDFIIEAMHLPSGKKVLFELNMGIWASTGFLPEGTYIFYLSYNGDQLYAFAKKKKRAHQMMSPQVFCSWGLSF